MLSFIDNDTFFDEILQELLAKKQSLYHFHASFYQKLAFSSEKQQSLCKLFEILDLGPDTIDPLYAATKAKSLALQEKSKEIKLKHLEKRMKTLESQLDSLEKLEKDLEIQENCLTKSENSQKKMLLSLKKAQNELIIPKNQAMTSTLAGNFEGIVEEFGGIECIPEDLEDARRILKEKERELEELNENFE